MKKYGTVKSGFSILEIIIVITIIAILAGATFGYLKYIQSAKLSNTESKLAALDQALEMYNTKVGEYPADLNELVEGPTKPDLAKRFGMSLAKAADLKDGWSKPFVYEKLASGNPPYELYSITPENRRVFSPASQQNR